MAEYEGTARRPNDSDELFGMLKAKEWNNKVLLLMSSGNFDGKNLNEFGKILIS